MFVLMTVLTVAGLALLLTAPWIARVVNRRGQDSVGLTRILQVIAVVLLIGALFARPRNLATTAVPPPPDSPEMQNR